MWRFKRWLKTYLGFLWYGLREYKHGGRYAMVKRFFKSFARAVFFFVFSVLGGLWLYEHLKPYFSLLPSKPTSAIIVLGLLLVLLLIVVEGLRRYHERILSESERRYNSAICEWEKCVINTRDFSAVVSAATELYQHLNGGSGESDEHMLKRWFADAERALENRLGRDEVVEFRGGSMTPLPIPATPSERAQFLNDYAKKFGDLVYENRGPKPPNDIIRRPE